MSHDLKIALASALVAAFLTFLIGRLGVFLNRVTKRGVLNLNALVKLEHLMNEYGMVVNDNRQNLEPIMEAVKNPGTIPLNRLGLIKVEGKSKLDLLDIELVNMVVGVEYTLRRLNDDARMINYHLDSLQSGVISGNINPAQYQAFLGSFIGQGKTLTVIMDDFLGKLAEVVAYIQLREEDDKMPSTKILHWLLAVGKKEITSDRLTERKQKVLKQLEKSRTDSIKENEELITRAENNE